MFVRHYWTISGPMRQGVNPIPVRIFTEDEEDVARARTEGRRFLGVLTVLAALLIGAGAWFRSETFWWALLLAFLTGLMWLVVASSYHVFEVLSECARLLGAGHQRGSQAKGD